MREPGAPLTLETLPRPKHRCSRFAVRSDGTMRVISNRQHLIDAGYLEEEPKGHRKHWPRRRYLDHRG